MAWLRNSGVEIADEEDQPDFDKPCSESVTMSSMPEFDENPLAWMNNSDDNQAG